MAKITFTNKVPLNENPDIADINKCKANDLNEIKQVVNENENKILIAVSDTAPAQCSAGDQYFNTTTKLIYTATATNTWGQTGVAPTLNTIYMVYDTQAMFSYDGDTLISVGGGKPPIAIQDEEPTDAVLWIKPNEPMQSLGTEVVNNIDGDQENRAPSVKTVKENFELKGTILYDNPNGSADNIVLSDSVSNYSCIEIFYEGAYNYNSARIFNPNGKSAYLFAGWFNNNSSGNIKIANVQINGTSITKINYTALNYSNQNAYATEENAILIRKVIGYK